MQITNTPHEPAAWSLIDLLAPRNCHFVNSEADKWDVVRIPADGGETVSLGASVVWGNRFRFPSAHPDGRRVAFDTSSGGQSFL